MWDTVLNYLSYSLLLSGAFLSLTFALGLIRLPDFYSRMHAAGVADSLCAALIIAGLAIQSGLSLVTLKLLLVLLFLWFTSPTASFALARSAYRAGYDHRSQEEKPSNS